ncbi:MAG: hypothetical protein OEM15_09215 [Myxococcales bacterium]|nr:hypothetical protein [Myxococcales bacterium]MDH3485707.1 hypothetical protein [Myxococcales bacterium]
MFFRFVIRDVAILLVTIGLWLLSFETEPGTTLASVVSISAGVGALVCAYNFHEWGHLVVARMTDSVFTPARRVISPFLFSYDTEHNTPRQFLLMSLGGFAATALFVVAFLLWMPRDQQAGRIALYGALILASLTVVIEFPIFFRALLGNTVPRTGMFKGPTVGGGQKNTP